MKTQTIKFAGEPPSTWTFPASTRRPKFRRVKPPKNAEEARDREQAIEHARDLIRKAIGHLRPAAPAAASYVARSLKSVDGALRHAAHWQYRAERAADPPCRHRTYYTINAATGQHRCTAACGYQFQDERRANRPWEQERHASPLEWLGQFAPLIDEDTEK